MCKRAEEGEREMVDEAVGMTRRRNTERTESTIGTVQIADMTRKYGFLPTLQELRRVRLAGKVKS